MSQHPFFETVFYWVVLLHHFGFYYLLFRSDLINGIKSPAPTCAIVV